MLNIALVGQPNSGKSTIFNNVAGYRSISANFPGSTVHYTIGETRIRGTLIRVADLPGTYSLNSSNDAEAATHDYLLTQKVDVLIHVMDASLMHRGLELTLELLDFQLPMIVCLNMMDDAERKGVRIDSHKLSELLGVPVVATVARKGIGLKELFAEALRVASEKVFPRKVIYGHKDIEDILSSLALKFHRHSGVLEFPFSGRFLAVKLLEGDPALLPRLSESEACDLQWYRQELEASHGRSANLVIHSERHALAMELAEAASTVGKPSRDFRERLDDVLMHRFWGYVFLFSILFAFFVGVFHAGAIVEGALLAQFQRLEAFLASLISSDSLLYAATNGVLQGVAGGVIIVLPYLIPFLLGLAILEDIGYLPRVAFLMDAFMHRIGLHGVAVFPAILGYGCNVPAVMATRILPNRRDRMIAAVISVLVPCSARTTVILALTGFYLGGVWAFALYVFNIAMIAVTGKIMCRMLPQLTPGMIMEVPRYQIPMLRSLLQKTWFRMREFVKIAWPLLIGGSVVLAFAQHFGASDIINAALSPFTMSVLGLPAAAGVTLIFGVFRKELSLLMLIQAFGTTQLDTVMTPTQILTFTMFVMFYIPCIATIGVLIRETGKRFAFWTSLYTFGLGTAVAGLVRVASFVIIWCSGR